MTASRIAVDIAIIGAGPAGIAAATRAAECGKRVLVLDENPNVGGQIWRHRVGEAPADGAKPWLARLERSGASRWHGAAVVDVSAGAGAFEVAVESSSPPVVVCASHLVIATGARERFLPFPGWTLSGVIGIGGAQALLKAGASFAKERVVIAGSGPLLLPVAASLAEQGAKLLMVAEQAGQREVNRFAASLWRSPRTLLQAARYRRAFLSTPYRCGWWIVEAQGREHLERVILTNGVATKTIECTILCAGFGLVPNTEIARLIGCAVGVGGVQVSDDQETSVPGVYCAGEPTGIGGVDLAVVEGEIAGYAAAGRARDARRRHARARRLREGASRLDAAFALRDELRQLARPDTIICRCEDVRMESIDADWGMRKAKLYTRAGMGPCQGRVCGAALQFIHGWTADSTRLPAEPALVSTLIATNNAITTTHGA